ncbi:hypothetical protein V1281_004610 [Nitrobacteraceae bacterium AZCC 2161]
MRRILGAKDVEAVVKGGSVFAAGGSFRVECLVRLARFGTS